MIFLKVYVSGKLFVSKQFVSDQISIGSGEGPSLILSSPSVSYWHALIEQRLGAYYVSDLGSPTGTFVNSQPVLESVLNHGDQITIGDFVIHFFVGVPFAKKSAVPRGHTAKVPPSPEVSAPMEPSQSPSPPLAKDPPSTFSTVPTINEIPDQFPEPSSSPLDIPPPMPKKRSPVSPPVEDIPPPTPKKRPSAPSPLKDDLPQNIQSVSPQQFPLEDNPSSEEDILTSVQSPKVPSPSISKRTPSIPRRMPSSVPRRKPGPVLQTVEEETESIHPLSKEEIIPPSVASSVSLGSQATAKPLDSMESHLTVVESKPKSKEWSAQDDSESLNLEDISSVGSVVEVVVAWKNRILSISHFKGIDKIITFGSDPKADIVLPNSTGTNSYSLLEIDRQVFVYVSENIKAKLMDKKKEYSFQDLMSKHNKVVNRNSRSAIILSQNQLIRLDFSPSIRVYVRFTKPAQKATLASFFDFNFSEMVGIMMSFIFLSGLIFYVYMFSPQFLGDDNKWEEGDLHRATIEFKRKRPRRVKLNLVKKARERMNSLPIKAKKTSLKKAGVNKPGKKRGRLGQVAPKPKSKSRKKAITSARSGGAVKTGKSGGSAKSSRPDPTKLGLLGVFGKKGTQTELDKAYSGTGELAGYAEGVTGYAGQKESYKGQGIGTEFKNVGAGGQGTNLIGVSGGIKTKGRGGGTRGYGTGGSLGSRGRVELRLGTDDWAVEGGIDKEAIRRVIRRHKTQLESCYEYALQKTPSLKGKVLLQWEIVGIKARSVKAKSNSTGDKLLARCLMSRLRGWDFVGTGLKRGQIGVVKFPFAFHHRK